MIARHELPLSVRADAWLIDALALDALGERRRAATALERALDFAGLAGLSRLIVAQSSAARALLRRHTCHGTAHPAIVGEALDALEHRGEVHRARVPLVASLSDREQAILRYLPTMMSNQEIAAELYVSVNTLRTHLKAIYRKLDAADRRHAVERGRQLGLMP
jgi:LuxR family maltose regulon positive regulatory protein